jgi:pSer/pThr/pTyr-binding forkhead associated (FHA) protein
MIQLHILSGNKTGVHFIKNRFPVLIGRAAEADISLNDPGVWPRHLQITRQAEGLVCQAEPNALVSINDAPVQQAVLRNGDVISIGALKVQFTLAPVRQSSLLAREWLVWIGLALLSFAQVALDCQLIK